MSSSMQQDLTLFWTRKTAAAPPPHEEEGGQQGGACCYMFVCTCNSTLPIYNFCSTLLLPRAHRISTEVAWGDHGNCKHCLLLGFLFLCNNPFGLLVVLGFIFNTGNSLRDPAAKAYDQVFAPHHSWTIRKVIETGMFLLPSKSQFLKKLNEEGMC